MMSLKIIKRLFSIQKGSEFYVRSKMNLQHINYFDSSKGYFLVFTENQIRVEHLNLDSLYMSISNSVSKIISIFAIMEQNVKSSDTVKS
jgi:hypothetical protein